MGVSAKELMNSPKFKNLVSTRWTVSFIMLAILFVVYYGYILIVAYNKPYLAQKMSEGTATTVGIMMASGVIIASWLLTIVYVLWANNSYDRIVEELKKELH